MAGIFFNEGPVETFDDVMASDAQMYGRFFHLMLDRGVYLAPSPYEALFISTAHGKDIVEEVSASVRAGMAMLSGQA
jgi:glutamate-1-semialdehyde 2,1-aminomutase